MEEVLITLLLFMIAHRVQSLCCLVFHCNLLFLFVIHVVYKICESFDRKKVELGKWK